MINDFDVEKEFYDLQQISSQLSTTTASDKILHARKNRYSNIHPCIALISQRLIFVDDDFRVRLKDCENDYINASHWEVKFM